MTTIPVEKGQPVKIGDLEIKVDGDEVIFTSTHDHNQTIATFKTEHFKLNEVIKIEAKTPFGMRAVSGGSETALMISQEVRDAYMRAIADGQIDENEQRQFQALQQALDAIDVKQLYASGGLRAKDVLPLEDKIQAIAR